MSKKIRLSRDEVEGILRLHIEKNGVKMINPQAIVEKVESRQIDRDDYVYFDGYTYTEMKADKE